jgi:hypothetical protein
MGFSSQSGQVIFRTQSVAGTYNADTGASGVAMKTRGGSLGPNRELMIPDPEIGGGRDVPDASLGAVSWGGDYDFYARLQSLPTLLAGVLGGGGSVTTTGVTTHTIAAADTPPPYLSIEENIGGSFETYNYHDSVVNTLHLEVDANGYLMGTVGLIAARQLAGATKTVAPVWDNTPLIVGTNCTITYNAVSLPAKNFSLDINNNYEDDDFRLGSFYIGDLTPKRREVTASFGIRESSSALWRQSVYGTSGATTPGGLTTKSALVISCLSYEDIPAGTPSTKYTLTITIPQFALTPYSIDASGDDVIESDIDGQALRPNPATPLLTAVVKNGTPAIA